MQGCVKARTFSFSSSHNQAFQAPGDRKKSDFELQFGLKSLNFEFEHIPIEKYQAAKGRNSLLAYGAE